MDFDEVLIRVQGALITLNRTKGLLKNVNVDKGENVKPSAFYNALNNIINVYKHTDADLRRIHLFLLLNSDFKFNDKIAEEENFSHLVFTAPTLDKFLFAETVLTLDLKKYICETIVFGHMTLSLEYLDILLHTLQSKKSVEFISVAESIISSVHRKLAILECERNIDLLGNLDQAKSKFSYYFKKLLGIFSPPHGDYEMGYVMKSLLSLLCACLDQRRNSISSTNESISIYSMSLPYSKIDNATIDFLDFSKSEDIYCLLAIFESNLNLVNLSTWMYWSECEWKSPNNIIEVPKTIQEIVGEQAFLCKQQLQHICNDLPEAATLSAVLSNMAIKPFSEEDEIEKTQDLSRMVSKVKESNRSPESKKKWLIAILKFTGALKSEACFECIKEYGIYLDSQDEILLLLERAAELINSNSVCQQSAVASLTCNDTTVISGVEEFLKDKVRRLVFKIFPQVSVETQGKLIGLFYEKCGLSNLFLTKDFDKIATEIFNKAVNTEENKDELFSDLCVLCLQSPKEVVYRLLVLAIGCNSQIPFVVEVLNTLSLICQLYVEKTKFTVTESEQSFSNRKITLLCDQLNILMKRKHWNETEKSNFVLLVVLSHKSLILHQSNFLHECLYPAIKDSLEASSWSVVDLCLETMNEFVSNSPFTMGDIENPAALLAVCLQILEKGKHDMREKFSVTAASTCELVISYLPEFLEKLVNQKAAEEKYISWLRTKVISASPFSLYYFHQLWSGTKDEVEVCKDYRSLLMLLFDHSSKFDETKMMDLLKGQSSILRYHLFKVLPSCTTSEWINIAHVFKEMIFQSKEDHENLYLHLFILLSDVLIVMITVASKKLINNEKEALYCVELWFKNFARIIKEEFWPCHKFFNVEKSCTVFHTIVNLLESVPKEENIRETCSFLMINILSDIISSVSSRESKNIYSDPVVLKLIACVSLISEVETRKGLGRKLMETLEKRNGRL